MNRRILYIVAWAVAAAGTWGCGGTSDSGRVVVKGRLLENGKPFTLDTAKLLGAAQKGDYPPPPGIQPNSVLQITFISLEGNETHLATVNPEAGTFEVRGPDGKGIKPGRYKIAVTAGLGLTPDAGDYFKGRYAAEKTRIIRDIKPGEDVEIDVAKPQG